MIDRSARYSTFSALSGLAADNAGDGHTVYLSWDPLPDSEIAGYEVYRGYADTSIAIVDTVFSAADTIRGAIEDSTLYFAVTAYTPDGWRSLIEDIVSVTPRSRPARPDTLAVDPAFGQLNITWAPTIDYDFDHYQLWRKVGDGDFSRYQQITGTPEYADQGLESNVRYSYYVTVVDTTGLESEPSGVDHAKIFSLDSGILLVDEKGNILDMNRAEEMITGCTREDWIGRPLLDMLFHTMPGEKKTGETYAQTEAAMSVAYNTGFAPWIDRVMEIDLKSMVITTRHAVRFIVDSLETPELMVPVVSPVPTPELKLTPPTPWLASTR